MSAMTSPEQKTFPEQKDDEGRILISRSSEIHGSLLDDTIVERNCFLHVRGNVKGDLTILEGARVIVEGSVDGKIANKGGNLTVHNYGALAEFISAEGPPENESGAVLKINLSAIGLNWATLARHTLSECAADIRSNAYGCGIDAVAGTLAKCRCKIFFVSDLAAAKRVRNLVPDAAIYVLGGVYPGTAPIFAQINAQPVINSTIEMAEWDAFVAANQWTGGFALNVKTGAGRFGIPVDEAIPFSTRVHSRAHGITLLMSDLDDTGEEGRARNESQIKALQQLRMAYPNIPTSLADGAGMLRYENAHFDIVRLGAALFGVNPTPYVTNPLLQVVDLCARIVQIRTVAPGEVIADNGGWSPKRKSRLAIVAAGYADGYPREGAPRESSARTKGKNEFEARLEAIVGGHRCPIAGRASVDSLAIDITDLPDPRLARHGEMVTLIGAGMSIDDVAKAARSTGGEVLRGLGHRFHRFYYAD
ncbi:MAG: alanine racemase [Xanthobacteraceae bacterium]|nr:alanine racemase [Xanthobacteraceae bacterium]